MDGQPEIATIQLRRYRCIECKAVCTVAPSGIATKFLYSLMAIGTALLLWAAWRWTAPSVRRAISPNQIFGASNSRRWRSLERWTDRSAELFAFPDETASWASRGGAARVARILIARGPPELSERDRVFIGACVR